MIKSKLMDKYISLELDIQQATLVRLEAMCGVLDYFSAITKLAGLKDFPTLICTFHDGSWSFATTCNQGTTTLSSCKTSSDCC
jgi:hypothetical protein